MARFSATAEIPKGISPKPGRHVVLEARNLTRRFSGVTAVRDVSFQIVPGEILGYLGPNGSGKTTTVNMLVGLLEPTSGTVLFRGADIRDDLVAYRTRLGYVPEEPSLYPFLTAREYLQLVGRLRRLDAPTIERRSRNLLQLFGLDCDGYSPLRSYSKGMRQKVLISAALMHNPDVLIFDEPLSGLDVSAAMVVRCLFRALADSGKTILYSSHVLEAVEKLCSRVVVLNRGEMVANDSVEHLRERMARGSLEEVFATLVVRDDPERIARDMVDAVQS
jgi:ABC-2 type transport system ATP-binding protein